MKVLITGASGLIGSGLVAHLTKQGHIVDTLSRARETSSPLSWNPENGNINLGESPDWDAVVHLAGESIAQGRWTAAKKSRIRDSRVLGTALLCETLAGMEKKPEVLISASAIGFYGDRGEEDLDEQSSTGSGFLAGVCHDWETATHAAQQAGIRVVQARLGVVLSQQGGALKAMLTPFKLGLGGRVGPGTQFMSWVSRLEVLSIIEYCLQHSNLQGPVNLVSPNPVNNAQFTKTLGKVLHRPTIFPMPAFVARTILGEMADELLLSSQKVIPKKLLDAGYSFQHPQLEQALVTP